MLTRKYLSIVKRYINYFPVVGIVGPRQVGKTTLVKELQKSISAKVVYLDLELPSSAITLHDPELYLKEHLDDMVIIDEVQRMPSLFPLLRALVDLHNVPGRFILLGSASPDLIRNSSESLAGRIKYQEIKPLDIIETEGHIDLKTLWLRGGFPKACLAPDDIFAMEWLASFVQTYIERDLPILGLNVSPMQTNRLWAMLAQLNGQLLNYSLLSKSLEISSPTLKRYVDFFESSFLVYRLQPYHKNGTKRLVKSPKIYFTDTGLLHYFLSIQSVNQLYSSIHSGNSWEAFCIQQILASLPSDLKVYFYRTQDGAECDLVFERAEKVVCAAEIKLTDVPSVSKGNYIAWADVKSVQNFVITPGSSDYPVNDNTRVCSINAFIKEYLTTL